WLINSITEDHRLASVGTLFVLCCGCIVGRYGVFNTFFDIGIPALPFLRRYQPAAAFPLFFLFQSFVWKALTSKVKLHSQYFPLPAAFTIAVLIFSYLYLWTAAAAWLVCIGVLWFCFRPSDRLKTATVLAIIAVLTALSLMPYFNLVSHRASTLDEQQ